MQRMQSAGSASIGPPREDAARSVEHFVESDSFEHVLANLRHAHVVEVRDLEIEVLALRNRLEDAATTSVHEDARKRRSKDPAPTPTPRSTTDWLGPEGDRHGEAASGGGAGENADRSPSKSAMAPVKSITDAAQSVPEAAQRASITSEQVSQRSMPPVVAWRTTLRRGLTESMNNKMRAQAEGEKHSWLWNLVRSNSFEAFFAAMILLNAFVMAADAQYVGFGLGFSLAAGPEYNDWSSGSEDVWPHGREVLDGLSMFFGVLFCLEIVIKIVGLRLDFLKTRWNWFDFSIVAIWVLDVVTPHESPVNVNIFRLARLARMLRFMRLFRIMKSQFAESMYLMSTALRNSISILTNACILLVVVHLMMALLMNQILREWYFTPDGDQTEQAEVYYYFGSFSRSLLTMFEITLANWPPACRVLMDNVHEAYMIYALIHKMLLGFAVVGVINAVFIQETFRCATADDAVMVAQTKQKQLVHRTRMEKLFTEADENNDDKIDVDEWQKVCQDEWVKVWLLSQDLGSTEDAIGLFKMMDNGDGQLSADELIQGVARLKGPCGNLQMMRALSGLCLEVERLNERLVAQGAVKPDDAQLSEQQRTPSKSLARFAV